MEIIKIPFDRIPQFSKRDKAYIDESSDLGKFYKYPVEIESFEKVIKDKEREDTPREVLIEVLMEQYSWAENLGGVKDNINKLLSENTFTVVTAHQPSLFTGPLYYIFKIISVINLTGKLNTRYPDYQFVPVFITSGEDHDFEEVNHLNIFNKTLTWESGESGPVGNMRTATLGPVLAELKTILGESDNANRIFEIIEKAHTNHPFYAGATIEMVHGLFKEEGLVILNMNHPKLKKLFIPIIEKEIFERVSNPIVNDTINQLKGIGFPAQASPREINFFYLGGQLRERIVFEDGLFKVLNTDLIFSKEEMEAEIENHPERFSPNVIMRPLFQELILPNLAYIGGGGELAYWLERKAQFEYFDINFPMLIRRNSAMWIDKGAAKKMDKFGLTVENLAGDIEDLIKKIVKENAVEELSLNAEKEDLKSIFEKIADKTQTIEPTLVKTVWAEQARHLKGLEQLETRLLRAEKHKQETSVNQIRSVKEKLFPGNGLQERHDNFLSFYLKYGDEFFEILKKNFDPFEKKFVAIKDL